MSAKRSRQDEEDSAKRPRIAMVRDDDDDDASEDITVDVMFARLLESSGRALVEPLNKHFISTVDKIDRQSRALHPEGIPRYAFHQACADYRRGMREAELRYLGEPASVLCFGNNESFQQAMPELLNDEEQSEIPRLPHIVKFEKNGKEQKVLGSSFRQVAAIGIGSAALDTSGRVWTWGASDDGGLGRSAAGSLEEATPAMVKFPKKSDPNDTRITQISAGALHLLYLSYNGIVYMSGTLKDADSGMFSMPTSDDPESICGANNTPVAVPELTDVVSVYSGEHFCVTLHGDRTLKTWGFGQQGELARSAKMATPDENGNYNLLPDTYKNLDDKGHFVDFKLDMLRENFLTPLPPIWDGPKRNRKVMNVACGAYHMLVAAVDEGENKVHLHASGLNQYGQLGLGDIKNRHMLTRVPFFDDMEEVGQLAAGVHFSLVLNAAGDALYSCGRGDYGALGIGPFKGKLGSPTPNFQRVHMPQGVFIKKISAGDATCMALTIDNELYTWGYEGTTGHAGFHDEDCPYPRKLEIQRGQSFRVHDCDAGGQHGILLASQID